MRQIESIQDRETLLKSWIEARIGPVVRLELQPRWRPAWIADVERGGETIPLYIKGAREDVHAVVPVELEGEALRILHEKGVPAPRQYGYCQEADAIVMERLAGESRLEDIQDLATRDKIVDQYVAALAKVHAIDIEEFVSAGFKRIDTPEDLRLIQFNTTEAMYLAKKRVPEPCNEFLRLWVRRNVPVDGIKASFITGDCFQMMYCGDRLMGVMDLEMAFIGDPLLDLSCLGMRDLSEKTGSVARIVDLYRELSGRDIDYKTLRFHLVAFSAASSLLISDVLFNPSPETDYFEYFVYYHGSLRIALEALADFLQIDLADLEDPTPVETPSSLHLAMLDSMAGQLPSGTDAERYLRAKIAAEVAFLKRRDAFGQKFDEAYLQDIAELIGSRPVDISDAEGKLEAFIHEAGPRDDVAILRLLYRQSQRQCFLADIPQNKRLRRFLLERIAPLR